MYKKILILFAMGLCFASVCLANVTTTFTLDNSSRETQSFAAHITIYNNNAVEEENWQLGFTFVRPITEITHAKIIQHVGDYYLIQGKAGHKNIPPYGKITFNIKGQYWIEHYTDTPAGYFLLTEHKGIKSKPIPITRNAILPAWHPDAGEDEYSRNINKNKTKIEGNPADNPDPKMSHSLIIPLPAEPIIRNPGNFIFTQNTKILVEDNNQGALKTADFLVNSLTPATGFPREIIGTSSSVDPIDNSILLTSKGTTADLGQEGYLLDVAPNSIVIRANTAAGLFYGVESLRQLFPPQIFKFYPQPGINWQVPCVHIKDYPRFAYRGVMLDVARHFQNIKEVKRLLDLMALNKLNNFQWHLSDDEGWRVQILAYPQLTDIGSKRGYGLTLPPALGSGIGPYGGFFTQDQIRDVVNYAADRHITIVPEIDMPGHARAMIKSLPNQLIDPEDKSEYTSVQGYNDDVLSPCTESTYTVIDKVMTEIASLFPGKYIHVGSDEVPDGAWEKSASCIAKNLTGKAQIQHYFLQRVQKIIKTKGKSMAGWEEVVNGGDLDQDTRVYSWQGVDAGIEAAQRGYPVIMAPAKYLYFDLAYNADPNEPGYYWAGYVDTFSVYDYSPITKDTPPKAIPNIKGVQGELWSENINSQDRLDYLAFPKMAALAELAWTPKDNRNWQNFSQRLGESYLPKLDQYGVLYRISLPGINYDNAWLKANIEFPGLLMKYTLDGTLPNQDSAIYTQQFSTMANIIQMRSVDTNNRGSRVTEINNN